MKWFIAKRPDGKVQFKCKLKCQTCISRTKKGTKCKKKTCVGVPYCWIHARYNKHLAVRYSNLIEGEKGLFAFGKRDKVVFRKGENIIKYIGERISKKELEKRYDYGGYDVTAPYTLNINGRNVDASCKRGLGAMANATFGMDKRHQNARLDENGHVVATKDIKDNQEILVDYGQDYWKGFMCDGKPCLNFKIVNRRRK